MTEQSVSATLVQAVRAHGGEVTGLDVAGGWLGSAGAGAERAVRVWRWTRGAGWTQHAQRKNAHRYACTIVKWSGSGLLLASGGVDGAVRIWSRALAERRGLAAPGARAVRALCWAGATRLAAGYDDGAVCVWRVGAGALESRVAALQGAVHALALAGRALLLAACTEGVLKVYTMEELLSAGTTGTARSFQWEDNAHDLGVLCADADEVGAVTGGQDALVRTWRLQAGRLQLEYTLEGHTDAVTSVRVARGRLASCSLDRTARLWADGVCLLLLQAHPRYLTCVVLVPDHSFMLTGSNDRAVRMWSLGSLTLDEDLEPKCTPMAHFALGDLAGIGPVEEEEVPEESTAVSAEWARTLHGGAINCISTLGDLLTTASSDGTVRVLRYAQEEEAGVLEELHILRAHEYPALACSLGGGGQLLLTAGLDGAARLWDVESGCMLHSVSGAGVAVGGGGGVRGARLAGSRPETLLLATDDGRAPLWTLGQTRVDPILLANMSLTGDGEAATCCAWGVGGEGPVAAVGAERGELRLYALPSLQTPPPLRSRATVLRPAAHDLGIQSCDFAPLEALGLPAREQLLATGGSDCLVRLWLVRLIEEEKEVRLELELVRSVEAHGGGVASVRWAKEGGEFALLASGGDDLWARVWRVSQGGEVVEALTAAPVPFAGGATAVAFLQPPGRAPLLALGTLTGRLALWALGDSAPPPAAPACPAPDLLGAAGVAEGAGEDARDGEEPQYWDTAGVCHWLREYVTRAPGSVVSAVQEAELEERVMTSQLTGARLRALPVEESLDLLGYGAESEDELMRERLSTELTWLQQDELTPEQEARLPHALLCPVTHRALRWPARAADGFTYERANLHHCLLAQDGVSYMSGRRLSSRRVLPNHAAMELLRSHLRADELG